MTDVLVDKDVVSFVFKGHPIGSRYARLLADTWPTISFMTVAELERWMILGRWGPAKRARFEEFQRLFSTIPFEHELCVAWATVMVDAQRSGFRIEPSDAWVAASAILYDLPLITHNRADYRGVPGLQIISLPE